MNSLPTGIANSFYLYLAIANYEERAFSYMSLNSSKPRKGFNNNNHGLSVAEPMDEKDYIDYVLAAGTVEDTTLSRQNPDRLISAFPSIR